MENASLDPAEASEQLQGFEIRGTQEELTEAYMRGYLRAWKPKSLMK